MLSRSIVSCADGSAEGRGQVATVQDDDQDGCRDELPAGQCTRPAESAPDSIAALVLPTGVASPIAFTRDRRNPRREGQMRTTAC